MRQVLPQTTDIDLGEALRPPTATWLRAAMVASLDGATQIDGRVGALTGPADQRVLWALRAMADVVLVGSGTVRAEGYGPLTIPADLAHLRPSSADPPLAILSSSGDLDPELPGLTQARTRPLLIVPDAAEVSSATARSVDILTAGEQHLDLTEAVVALRQRGYAQILSEGGPATLGRLLADDLVDELCITTEPVTVGGNGARLAHTDEVELRRFHLHALLMEDQTLVARWIRART